MSIGVMSIGALTRFWPDFSAFTARPGRQEVASGSARPRGGPLALYDGWVHRLNDARTLREMDPRMACDIGAPAGRDRCPDGYAVDPRPLWDIGLTPLPMGASPPWSERCRG